MVQPQEDDILIGGYSFETRRNELSNLEHSLSKITTERILDQVQKNCSESPDQDVFTLFLKHKMEEIQELKTEIELFENPGEHFNKKYRSMQGHCVKILTDLDGVDVNGREDLRKRRKRALDSVNQLDVDLTAKVHKDGKLCKECQVRD